MLAVITAVNAVNWADRQVVPILFPGIRSELALSDTQLGIVGGLAFSLVYALSSFGFGYAADRTIRRNVVVVGLVVWSMATAASGLATSFGSLFAARFLTGVGEASLYPATMSLIAERFPVTRRGRAMGIFGAAAAVGGGLGVGLGGFLAAALGWRRVFFIYGAAGLLLVPLLLSVPEARREPRDGDGPEPAGRVIAELLCDRRLLLLWTAGLVMIAGGFGYAAWIPSFFVRDHGFDVAQAGYLFGLAALVGGMTGSLLGGVQADRFRARRLAGELDLSAAVAVIAVPLVVLVLATDRLSLLVTGGILGPVAIYAFFPPLQTVLTEIVPQRRLGLAYAINILFLAGIGQALGPFVVGRVSDATGSLVSGLYIATAAMGVASVLAFAAGRVIRRDTPRRLATRW
jgi:MFS transporter, Spinster family, sphingosine-1-phosphate transporter